MKKIINGRKYDTETAQIIAQDSLYLGGGNFRNFKETLYRKKTGEFFLYGEGGPLTKYVEHTGFGDTDGEKIIPLDDDDAKFWVEKNCDVELYEKLFGEVSE